MVRGPPSPEIGLSVGSPTLEVVRDGFGLQVALPGCEDAAPRRVAVRDDGFARSRSTGRIGWPRVALVVCSGPDAFFQNLHAPPDDLNDLFRAWDIQV
eukprot:920165-Alexandrium_andersonii.AAC.1